MLYARKPQLAKAIAGLHENPDYLPGVALTPALDATADPAEALDGADLVVFCARAVAAGQPGGLGAAHPARGAAGQPHEGDRAP